VCSKAEGHVGAAQIFCTLRHPRYRTSTVKHHCICTDFSACNRACGNQVGPDRKVQEDFSSWFRSKIIPEFMNALDKENISVDHNKWLKRFPGSYQKKIERAIDVENQTSDKYSYEAFAKIEQQFTTVLHEDKDTSKNDVKERQICGPSDQKKLFGNPFIYELEGVAHRHLPEYCGRKNWMEICETIDSKTQYMSDPVFGAADGSGFDMTQLAWQNELMNELIIAAAEHVNVSWCEPLTVHELKRVLMESINLNVNSGNVKYSTQGRASGDGWTTFGNTMLMRAYWMYTFYKAGITDYFLLIKGDDVLMAFERKHLEHFNTVWPKYFTSTKTAQDHGLGQICTKIKFGDIVELDFLSNHFFRTKHGSLRMTRIPARIIQSNSWSTKAVPFIQLPNYHKYAQELTYSKGMCLKAWAGGLPIWSVLADKMIQLGRPGTHTEFNEYSDSVRVWHDRDDSAAYKQYLHDWFGLTESEITNIEKSIASITSLTGSVYIPELDKLYDGLE